MKKLFLFITLLTFSSSSFAVELAYKWQKGQSYRFKMNAKDDISLVMNMMGMNQETKETYLTETTLKIEVTSVDEQGTAKGFLYVESFSVKTASGVKVAGLESIPSKALKAEMSIDKKGNFTFYKKVFVIIKDNTTLLVSGKLNADGTQASASATAGGQEVKLHAEFNPKTGTLKAGYSQNSVAAPVDKKVEVKVEDDKIDIIPYQVLDLLALPEGNTNAGDVAKVESGFYTIDVKTISATATAAQIENTISTNKSKSSGTQKVTTTSDNGNMNMDMNSMGDMGTNMTSGMDDMDKEMNTPIEGTNTTPKDMMPQTDGKFICSFNVTKGMLDKVEGNMKITQDLMGVKLSTNSTVKLVAIP